MSEYCRFISNGGHKHKHRIRIRKIVRRILLDKGKSKAEKVKRGSAL